MVNYKITAVTIEIKPGVILTAEISSPAELKQLLTDLDQEGFDSLSQMPKGRETQSDVQKLSSSDTPISRIETRASLPPGKLVSAKALAFKDGSPQLLRPSAFASVSDATLSLLYAVEIGLQKPSIPYDDFKDLYDAQNIKSGSALPVLLTNLRNTGYIDKKTYTANRMIRLTAKGVTKAEEVIKNLCGLP